MKCFYTISSDSVSHLDIDDATVGDLSCPWVIIVYDNDFNRRYLLKDVFFSINLRYFKIQNKLLLVLLGILHLFFKEF